MYIIIVIMIMMIFIIVNMFNTVIIFMDIFKSYDWIFMNMCFL